MTWRIRLSQYRQFLVISDYASSYHPKATTLLLGTISSNDNWQSPFLRAERSEAHPVVVCCSEVRLLIQNVFLIFRNRPRTLILHRFTFGKFIDHDDKICIPHLSSWNHMKYVSTTPSKGLTGSPYLNFICRYVLLRKIVPLTRAAIRTTFTFINRTAYKMCLLIQFHQGTRISPRSAIS